MRKALRIGGVPEHFNYPWRLAKQEKLFETVGQMEVQWEEIPGGTGAMRQALIEDRLDVALMLTEGALKSIADGEDLAIIGTYVRSPLTWGIHVHSGSTIQTIAEAAGKTIAISRQGSGSHLMAYVWGKSLGWDMADTPFEIVGNFAGARQSFAEGRSDVFLWEKYTTKPTVDAGEWRRIGEFPTPWPCFLLVARKDVIESRPEDLKRLMRIVRRAMHLKTTSQTHQYISEQYQLQLKDVAEWYDQHEWSCQPHIHHTTIEEPLQALLELGLIEEVKNNEFYVANFCHITDHKLSQVMYDWRIDSVHKLLSQKGKATGPLDIQDLIDLGHLDQYHYLGDQTSYEIVDLLKLQPQQSVYDIGSGVGGTSRILAHASGCSVIGIEVQPELNELATELTQRVGLGDKVHYITADFLSSEVLEQKDHFISLLVFLHLPNRPQVLKKCFDLLKPGGTFVIEDLTQRGPFTEQEAYHLRHIVSAPSVTDTDSYRKDLEDAGFVIEEMRDMSDPWTDWVVMRYESFRAEEATYRDFFGPELYDHRCYFYQTIQDLFKNGHMGGVRIVGSKPGS
ncbi:MAG: methyltransferase domain-containing protein [Bacteroidota bacterium]